ncbi:hypothetical protein D3C86_1502340 [compost metagenome]
MPVKAPTTVTEFTAAPNFPTKVYIPFRIDDQDVSDPALYPTALLLKANAKLSDATTIEPVWSIPNTAEQQGGKVKVVGSLLVVSSGAVPGPVTVRATLPIAGDPRKIEATIALHATPVRVKQLSIVLPQPLELLVPPSPIPADWRPIGPSTASIGVKLEMNNKQIFTDLASVSWLASPSAQVRVDVPNRQVRVLPGTAPGLYELYGLASTDLATVSSKVQIKVVRKSQVEIGIE